MGFLDKLFGEPKPAMKTSVEAQVRALMLMAQVDLDKDEGKSMLDAAMKYNAAKRMSLASFGALHSDTAASMAFGQAMEDMSRCFRAAGREGLGRQIADVIDERSYGPKR